MTLGKLDITRNNLSNTALSTPAGEVDPAAHMAAQDLDTMIDFLQDGNLVDNPLSDDTLRKMTKNDIVYAVREAFDSGALVTTLSVSGTSEISLGGSETTQLTVLLTRGGLVTDVTGSCSYSSDDELVATVSASGLVTPVGEGVATITATYVVVSEEVTDTIGITVVA